MSIVIGPGQVAVFVVPATLADGTVVPVTGTATIDDYTTAYVANTGNKNEYMVVPKITLQPGQSVDVNVTFSATDQNGNALSTFVQAFTIQGPAAPPPTATLGLGSSTVVDATTVTVPPDPGSATIPIA